MGFSFYKSSSNVLNQIWCDLKIKINVVILTHWIHSLNIIPMNSFFLCFFPHYLSFYSPAVFLLIDQLRNSYQVGYDNSMRVIYANGMDSHFQTEPHILAGASNPTVARRNMTLPGENGQNLVEWRFRKEQNRGKVVVFGRKLRVCKNV